MTTKWQRFRRSLLETTQKLALNCTELSAIHDTKGNLRAFGVDSRMVPICAFSLPSFLPLPDSLLFVMIFPKLVTLQELTKQKQTIQEPKKAYSDQTTSDPLNNVYTVHCDKRPSSRDHMQTFLNFLRPTWLTLRLATRNLIYNSIVFDESVFCVPTFYWKVGKALWPVLTELYWFWFFKAGTSSQIAQILLIIKL